MRLGGLARRAVHLALYHLHVKRRIARTDVIRSFGFTLTIPPTVFHPDLYLTTRFLGSYLEGIDVAGKKGLEMGCGSGLLSLIAARRGAHMVAVDINPAAVAATEANAGANSMAGRIIPLRSDLFAGLSPLHREFDFIICNPPYFEGAALGDAEKAWRGGKDHDFLRRFASGASGFLRPGGTITFVLSSDADVSGIVEIFRAAGLPPSLVRTERRLFENLLIFEAHHR